MRISDWSSDVCSSDLRTRRQADERQLRADLEPRFGHHFEDEGRLSDFTSLVGAGTLPLPPRLRRHPKAARFLGTGRFLFWRPSAGEQEVKIRNRDSWASAPACAKIGRASWRGSTCHNGDIPEV